MSKLINKKVLMLPFLVTVLIIALCSSVFAADANSDLSQLLKKFQDTNNPIDSSTINSNTNVLGDNMDTLDNALKTIYSEPAVSANYDKICPLLSRSNISGIKIFVDGKLIEFSKYNNVNPAIIDDRVYVPVRAIVESLGAAVNWNESTGTINIQFFDNNIELAVDSTDAVVNGSPVTMDAPARIIDERTLVPIRFISESLSKTVEWHAYDESLKVIAIY